jgi:DNA-binding beta-propeller fold protein YncE
MSPFFFSPRGRSVSGVPRELKKFLPPGLSAAPSLVRGAVRRVLWPVLALCLITSCLGSALAAGANSIAGAAASRPAVAAAHDTASPHNSEQPHYVSPPPNSKPDEILRLAGGAALSRFTSGIPALDVALSNPGGVAVNSAGDIYIADTDDNEIREVFRDGIIVTIAGNGIAGFTGNGGLAIDAELNHPEGVAVDSSGDVFIADTGNNEVREITEGTKGPQINAYAGTGIAGYSTGGTDAVPTLAELNAPYSVAVGPDGSLAIGDTNNNLVRLVYESRIIINDGSDALHDGMRPNEGFPYTLKIATDAGGGTSYGEGGAATNASLSDPTGVAFDSAGDLFIADTGDSAVREVSYDTGDISTAVYTPYPTGVAVDANGNLFIADPVQNEVLELPVGGSLKRLAGFGLPGESGDGGPGVDAELYYPAGLAIDSYDDVFVADTDNSLVREVVAARVPYFFLDSPPLDAGAKQVYYYEFGAYGVPTPTYKLDGGAPSWLVINHTTGQVGGTLPAGVTTFTYSVVASNSTGSTTAGPFTVTVPKPFVYIGSSTGIASFTEPLGLSEAGSPLGTNLFVADYGANHVVKLSSIAQYEHWIGSKGTGAGQLETPTGVAVDPEGNIWVVDDGNDRMEEFSGTTGNEITTLGSEGSNTGEFYKPGEVTFGPNGNMYVSDTGNDRIEEFTTNPVGFVTSFGSAGSGAGHLNAPTGLAFTSTGDLLVADTNNNRIVAYTSYGLYLGKFGTLGTKLGQFDHPFGVAVDSAGDIFVTDRGNNRVEEFSSTAEPIDQFGKLGHGNGQLDMPTGIGISAAGILSVVDTGNKRIEQFAEPTKPVFTVDSPPLTDAPLTTYSYSFHATGEPTPTYSISGAPAWLEMDSSGYMSGTPPSGTTSFTYSVIATDSSGSTRTGPFTVAVTTPLGYIGQFGSYGSGDGELNAPSAVAVNPVNGYYYVVDRENDRVEVFTTSGTYVDQFGSVGSGDGELDIPYGIAFDSAGHIWVDDLGNDRVEEFSSAGTYMSQFGSCGSSGGFSAPQGIAIAPTSEDVYVADTGNDSVVECTSSGALVKQLSVGTPTGVAVTSGGELYVADDSSDQIVGYTASGTTPNVTYGGLGTGNGEVEGLSGIAVDSAGDIWVSDFADQRIEEFSSTGAYLAQFGSFGSGNGEFDSPAGLAVTSTGVVLVADLANNRIEEFQEPPDALVYASKFGSNGTGNGEFAGDTDVVIGPAPDDDFYVVDHGNNRIEEFSSAGAYVTSWGTSGTSAGELDGPAGVAFTSGGDVWVTNETDDLVQEFTASGAYVTGFGSSGSGSADFISPQGIAIDQTTGDIFVADSGNDRVQEFSSTGAYMAEFTTTSYGSLTAPIGVAVSPDGELYIADNGNDVVVGFGTASDTQNLLFGSSGTGQGQFSEPTGLGLDSNGNIWVADGGNDRVEEFSSTGAFLSQFGSAGSGNGKLDNPNGLAVSSTGVVSVADLGNNRIEQFGPA